MRSPDAASSWRRTAATCRRRFRDGGRRFGLAAHLYALRRRGDQGIGDFTTLVAAGRGHRARGRQHRRHQSAARALRRGSGAREPLSPVRPALSRSDLHRRRARCPISRPRATRARCSRKPARASRRSRRAATSTTPASGSSSGAVLDACFAQFERRSRRRSARRRVRSLRRRRRRAAAAVRAVRGDRRRASARALARAGRDDLREPDAAGRRRLRRPARAPGPLRALPAMARGPPARPPPPATRGRAASRSGFFRDLAVGAAPDGAEAWANPAAFARGVSIGAPPDPFSPTGQNWGLPPPNPAGDAGVRVRRLSRARSPRTCATPARCASIT